jgi:hypothetical protein
MHQSDVGAPFERFAVDIARCNPESKKGNRYLLVSIDYITKWPSITMSFRQWLGL